jgi:hypothetical protein
MVHHQQPQPTGHAPLPLIVESDPVVPHLQSQAIASGFYGDPDLVAIGMLHGIGNRFLRDPLHGDSHFERDANGRSIGQVQASMKYSSEPAHKQVERGVQSGALDYVRI